MKFKKKKRIVGTMEAFYQLHVTPKEGGSIILMQSKLLLFQSMKVNFL